MKTRHLLWILLATMLITIFSCTQQSCPTYSKKTQYKLKHNMDNPYFIKQFKT